MTTEWKNPESPFETAWRSYAFIYLVLPMIFFFLFKNIYLHIIWVPIGVLLLNVVPIFKPIKQNGKWPFFWGLFFLFLVSTIFTILIYLNQKLSDHSILLLSMLTLTIVFFCNLVLGSFFKK